ncbi:VOC family protein [Fusobacterium perfoetens]|uniref:VOC family protein n=1 Tax=Fusobacterium TaxID=848 RepID=UPI0026EE07F9|nr:VOC family protein [Fusobacterium perfoetens]
MGFTHLAFKVDRKEKVDEMTENFRKNGYKIVGENRTTGDGCYESIILDPDGNRISWITKNN